MLDADPTDDPVARFARHALQLRACAEGLIQAGELLADAPVHPDTLRAAETLYAACVTLTGRLAFDLAAIRRG